MKGVLFFFSVPPLKKVGEGELFTQEELIDFFKIRH